MDIRSMIEQEVAEINGEMIRLRRDFHMHPELGLQERRTAGVIAEVLERLGMDVRQKVGQTGVVGLLEGTGPGKTLMLRADMDALPIQEITDLPHRSENNGVMHACGHDGHMAILLGTAHVLTKIREHFSGRVKFVFQPAEERPGGALCMIEEGVLDNPRVDAAFGLHLIPALNVGTIGWSRGIMMAAMDTFRLKIRGRGGHSAMPEGSIDAIAASARVVTELLKLCAKDDASLKSSLINVGTIRGGSAVNIVADEVELTGTVRTLDNEVRAGFPAAMMNAITDTAREMNAEFELDYEQGCPPLINNPGLAELARQVILETPWGRNLIEMPAVMGSEDMAFYLDVVPGCFLFLGAGNPEKGIIRPLHSPDFDFDESALAIGATIMSRVAHAFLNRDG